MPYGDIDFDGDLFVSRYHGTISYLDFYEPYMPDRCSRQFGRVQGIPGRLIRPTVAIRHASHTSYKLQYPPGEWAWENRPTHLISLEQMGDIANPLWQCTEEYFPWYCARAHRFICPPIVGQEPIPSPYPPVVRRPEVL